MGTWDAGPFHNDAAMDLVAELVEGLVEVVDEFLESPEIDETFDTAFASIALLNDVMERTSSRPWDAENACVRDPEPIIAAMLECYDTQIDGMRPEPQFKVDHRAALVAELDRFRSHVQDRPAQ